MQHELIAFVVLRELTRLPEQSSSSTAARSRQHNVDESDEVRVLERGVNQRCRSRKTGDWLAALDDVRNWLIREAA
jgi:hypothetical protein